MSSTQLPAKETLEDDDGLIFSYSVRELTTDPECVPREAFLKLLEKTWQKAGFDPADFAGDFLKRPPTRVVVFGPTTTGDDGGETKQERKAVVKGINREPLDLHRLFCEVWKLDGFGSVTNNKQWPLVAIACKILKTDRLSKASMEKMAGGEGLNLGERRIIMNVRNTYEKYLLQLELRMTNARRILAARGRYSSHANKGLVEINNTKSNKPSTAVPPGLTPGQSTGGPQTIFSQPHLIHTRTKSRPISSFEFGDSQGRRKMVSGCSTGGGLTPNGLVGEHERAPTQTAHTTQDILNADYRIHEPLDPNIEKTVVQPSGFLRRSSSATQLASWKREESQEPSKGTDTAEVSENRESDHPLKTLNSPNFSWDDQIREEIISPLPRNSDTKRTLRTPVFSWYWAAESERVGVYSAADTWPENGVQIPSQHRWEHIVPEAYWAAEGRRLGMCPVSREQEGLSIRDFRDFEYDKENYGLIPGGLSPELCESNALRKIGYRLRKGLARKKAVPTTTTGSSQRQLLRRIFGRKATAPNRSKMCCPETPTADRVVVGHIQVDSTIQVSHAPISPYLAAAAEQGAKHEMTYRARVERYE
ncbi:hypothetical protein GP486_000536 [Trichoglossum hirsutum]|uniref:ARID domain-containing protein n=1 Tax=Trichoglossum hirsutum TaxID=265104 RepID=A0A9P8RTJ8_9PEZI|nr:hypothetical protein GP486_000536 [Trichoglossum hirsutum]